MVRADEASFTQAHDRTDTTLSRSLFLILMKTKDTSPRECVEFSDKRMWSIS